LEAQTPIAFGCLGLTLKMKFSTINIDLLPICRVVRTKIQLLIGRIQTQLKDLMLKCGRKLLQKKVKKLAKGMKGNGKMNFAIVIE